MLTAEEKELWTLARNLEVAARKYLDKLPLYKAAPYRVRTIETVVALASACCHSVEVLQWETSPQQGLYQKNYSDRRSCAK